MEYLLSKKDKLFMLLAGFFITNALLAEIIGAKIFSLEQLLNIPPANIHFFGLYTLDFNLTAGVIIWPFVFTVSDVINEYYGIKGVRQISYATACFIAFAFIVIYATTHLPPSAFWLQINNSDPQGNAFNINYAFSVIFRQGLGIIIGSLTAFLIGQILDAVLFFHLRKRTKGKYIWIPAVGSTIVSQLIDSFLVLIIAFYWFGNWSLSQVLAVSIMNFIYKVCMAIAFIPVLYFFHFLVDKYLGKTRHNIHEQGGPRETFL